MPASFDKPATYPDNSRTKPQLLALLTAMAFTAPLFGVAMAILFGGEPVSARTLVGMVLTVAGIVLLTVG